MKPAAGTTETVHFEGERLTLGRSNSNDVVLDDVNVSRFHAEILPVGGELELRDLDSRCGTRLDGRPVKRAVLRSGARIGIGAFELVFDGSSFERRDQHGALRLEARGVTVRVDGRELVRGASLGVAPGELVAIIGESGSGKTTLMKALAGVIVPSAGGVELNGEPVTARQTDVGYVPQQEIVHGVLTVKEALGYAARLRLAPDVSRGDREATVSRVLAELSLEAQAETRIASLSGGERKRAGVATELLGRPSLLCLDEPTTGLDPALESQLMGLFRALAEPGARAVVLVTHATKNLALCDKLAVLGSDGELAFFGRPSDALRTFGVDAYDDIYTALDPRPAPERRPATPEPRGGQDAERGDGARAARPVVEPGPAGSPRAKQRFGPQLATLVSRYTRLFFRDPRNLLILLGQVPVIAVAIAFLFQSGVFEQVGPGGAGDPHDQVQLLFLLVTTAIWFGSIDGSREIVKERSVSTREAAVGVGWSAYLTSKVIVLFVVAALQTLTLTYFVLAIRPLDEPVSVYLALSGLLVLTSLAGLGVGLLVSAAVKTEDQATSFIPLTLIPQLLFAGAIVPVEEMGEPIATASAAAFARWALAGAGGIVDMEARIDAIPRVAEVLDYGDFFSLAGGQAAAILLAFTAGFLAVAAVLLRRAE